MSGLVDEHFKVRNFVPGNLFPDRELQEARNHVHLLDAASTMGNFSENRPFG